MSMFCGARGQVVTTASSPRRQDIGPCQGEGRQLGDRCSCSGRAGFAYLLQFAALARGNIAGGVDCRRRANRVRGIALRLMGMFSGPPWSRWSTLPAGWRFATRDSARGPLISLGGSRTCARCRGDTAPRSSSWPGSIPAASTFNNNFTILLHDRPPKSQERPNGRVRGRALLPCPPRW
jgi:hypothetical protein